MQNAEETGWLSRDIVDIAAADGKYDCHRLGQIRPFICKLGC